MEQTEFFDYKVGALVEHCDTLGKQDAYHKERGIGVIVDWHEEWLRWKVHWAGIGNTTFEWSDNLRTVG